MESGAVRLQDGIEGRSDLRRARQRAVHAEVPSSSIPPLPGATTAAAHVPWERTIVYELHVRGYTKLHPDVPEEYRGTFAGCASRK